MLGLLRHNVATTAPVAAVKSLIFTPLRQGRDTPFTGGLVVERGGQDPGAPRRFNRAGNLARADRVIKFCGEARDGRHKLFLYQTVPVGEHLLARRIVERLNPRIPLSFEQLRAAGPSHADEPRGMSRE